jgi:hypothetical protein
MKLTILFDLKVQKTGFVQALSFYKHLKRRSGVDTQRRYASGN